MAHGGLCPNIFAGSPVLGPGPSTGPKIQQLWHFALSHPSDLAFNVYTDKTLRPKATTHPPPIVVLRAARRNHPDEL